MATTTPRLEAFQRQLKGVRWRVLCVFLAFGLGMSLTWYYQAQVFAWLLAPARGQLSETGQPIFTGPTEMFALAVRLTILGGVAAATPVLAYNVARFFSPLLSPQYKRLIAICLPLGFVFYLAGAAFAYYVMLPVGIGFLLQFGTGVAMPYIRITEYMDLAQAMLFWLGVVFELPMAMFLLAKMRLVSHKRFSRFRRYIPVSALILSAIITPTFDPVTQVLVAVPIVLLYEVGLFLSWLTRPRQKRV